MQFKRSFSAILGISAVTALIATSGVFGGEIRGSVRDDRGAPISEALVMIQETGYTTRTDEEGVFRIKGLEAGKYNLIFMADGFEERSSPAVNVQEEGRRVMEISLLPVFRTEIVVTGTRTEKRLTDVPVRTELVSREEIESTASRTLADAVEFTTGIRVESNCQNCNFSQIRLLGLDGTYSQILVDGQPLVSSLAQVYGIEHIASRMIDRIEIVKGGGSSIYGPGSVGGVINVIPHEPITNGGVIESTYEDMDGAGNYSINGAIDHVLSDDLSATVFGQVDRVKPLDTTGDGITEVSRRKMETFGFRLNRYLYNGDGRLTIEYNKTKENRRGGDSLDKPEFRAEIAESVRTSRDVAALSWLHFKSESFYYKSSFSYVYTERDSYYGAGMDPNAYGDTENPLTVFDSQFNHVFTEHILSYGMQFNVDELEDRQPAYDRFTDESYTNAGLFLQDDWKINDEWEIIAGIRGDKHSKVDNVIFSPRLALKWKPSSPFTVRLSAASGFKPPQIFDEDLHITQVGGEGAVIRNDPDLQEESSVSYNLGGEWTPKISRAYGLIECNLFYTALSDLFNVEETDNPETPEMEFTRVNYGEAAVYGVECNIGYMIPGKFKIDLGYVEQKAKFDEPEPDFGSKDFFRTPERYGVAGLTWMNPRLFDVFIGGKFTGEMKVPHYAGYIDEDRLETTDNFFTVDANISRHFKLNEVGPEIELTIGGKNLTDEYQDDLDQGQDRDAGYVYGPRFPRSYYVKLAYDF